MFKNVTNTELNKMLYFTKLRYNSQKGTKNVKVIKELIDSMEKEIQRRSSNNGEKIR